IVSQEGVEELLAVIPGSRSTLVEGAGHMVAGDDNSVFVDKVGEFLADLPVLSSSATSRTEDAAAPQ
ncbi:alpha/beta fold hydrolase, partial [Rhodococcus sp. PML026]